MNTPKIYVVPALSVEEYRPQPEELAKQASRRMDTTHGLAAILRDARKGALLRMRSEIYFTSAKAGDAVSRAAVMGSRSSGVLPCARGYDDRLYASEHAIADRVLYIGM